MNAVVSNGAMSPHAKMAQLCGHRAWLTCRLGSPTRRLTAQIVFNDSFPNPVTPKGKRTRLQSQPYQTVTISRRLIGQLVFAIAATPCGVISSVLVQR